MLDVALDCLKLPPSSDLPIIKSNTKNTLLWTADICNIVEIIYALFHSKCLNHGEATLKQITEGFEKMLNIKLQNISHIYLRIRGRAGQRSVFLNKLLTNLNTAMLETDK